MCGTVVQWSALMPHSKKVPGLIPMSGPFYMEFTLCPCVYVGSLWTLWLPPTVQKTCKGGLGSLVNLNVHRCESVCE